MWIFFISFQSGNYDDEVGDQDGDEDADGSLKHGVFECHFFFSRCIEVVILIACG